MHSGKKGANSFKQPTHQYGVHATALSSQTLGCGALPNRHWLLSKQRKEDSSGVNQYTALLRGLCRLRYIVCPDFER